MKRFFRLLILALMLPYNGLTNSRADDHKTHRSLLQTIQANAKDIQRSTVIFQWARVNQQVDRILAEEKRLRKAMILHTELQSECEAISKAVSTLRSARLKRDAGRAADAAKKLLTLTTDLLKKESADIPYSA